MRCDDLCTICGKELKKDYRIRKYRKLFQILNWQGFQPASPETRYSTAFQHINVSLPSDIYECPASRILAHRGLERATVVVRKSKKILLDKKSGYICCC
jgi:hypothetical protein